MKTYIKATEKAIIEAIEEMSSEEQMEVHNQYCENANYMDDQIFYNDEEFFEMFFNGRTTELIRAMEYGDHRINDKFVKFNGYANLESFNDVVLEIDINCIAEDILETDAANYYSIELEEEEEEEEE